MQTNRRQFIKTAAVATTALSVAPLLASCEQAPVNLTILHTNDVHSHIDPFPANDSKWPLQGGFARRAQLINDIRREQEHVLLFDCGDIFQGTPYFNIYKGKLEIELMNKMAYDAATIGNHEFDNGVAALATNIKRAQFPFVCSNYDLSGSGLDGLTIPFKIIRKGALTIGIIGLGIELDGLANPKSYEQIQYKDPIKEANNMAQHLKQEQGCDLVIALSHLGYQYQDDKVSDVQVAKQTKGIDIILGGHTHTFMDKPDRVINMDGDEVIVNQAGWGGIYLGRLDLQMKANNQKNVTLVNSIYHV
ncbi:metallophosphoesterase [Carboxylicivirga sp. M1479]|uniref:metallophosphoesterase n=1 Tax=Carboxylicivirga sp. M1479 TaxID=2594476 RepID=UPI0011786449|nr:metallophosphoesterase [Carboxylicivirga sp. M1479]TRX63191.1 twin-arginine translocation signal domain-containing protein [Carboxylicivirga sp. M1479]